MRHRKMRDWKMQETTLYGKPCISITYVSCKVQRSAVHTVYCLLRPSRQLPVISLRSDSSVTFRKWNTRLRQRPASMNRDVCDVCLMHDLRMMTNQSQSCIPTLDLALLFANKLSVLDCPAFSPLQSGAAFSSPAISAPAFLIVPHFPVSHFQSPSIDYS